MKLGPSARKTIQGLLLLAISGVFQGSVFAQTVRFGSIEFETLEELDYDVALFDQEIHFDQDGLIVHKKGSKLDGGDTSQREGWYWLGIWLRKHFELEPWPHERQLNFDQVIRLMEPDHNGVFYRHPKLRPWNDPRSKDYGTSRDQLEPMIAALGVWGKNAELKRLWKALPETTLGKHAFNGKYKSLVDQIGKKTDEICDDDHADDDLGPDCDEIQNRSCDQVPCVFNKDERPCDLQKDTRPCELRRDKRSCGRTIKVPGRCSKHGIPYPCTKKKKINDPKCELDKTAANARYKAEKDACELAREKANADHKANKDLCEAAKVSLNVIYKAEYDRCQVEMAAKRAKCEVDKEVDTVLCRAGSIHCGDLIMPMTVNLFRRALLEDPMIPASQLKLPAVNVGGGQLGENDLAGSVASRVYCAAKNATTTGDDLNLIVRLLMAKLRFPSPTSEAALRFYSQHRSHSYGSFFTSYIATYGDEFDEDNLKERMRKGVENGWKPDTIPAVGATRWYHRPSNSGANPRLADLYQPILELLLVDSQKQENVGGTSYKECE
jgi:hypothetical protein